MGKKPKSRVHDSQPQPRPTGAEETENKPGQPPSWLLLLILLVVGGIAWIAVQWQGQGWDLGSNPSSRPQTGAADSTPVKPTPSTAARNPVASRSEPLKFSFDNGGQVHLWWDEMTRTVARRAASGDGQAPPSNVRRQDYAGPETCAKCHERNFKSWQQHPHRWMNALASRESVRGDFGPDARMEYLGGVATFFQQDGGYRMRLERAGQIHLYEITQTIGSRFFQYYIGRLLVGPEPRGHVFYDEEHVLPFGYWLDEQQWVPTVHVGPELPDGQRLDPFAPVADDVYYNQYAKGCSHCHSTYAFGDWVIREPDLASRHVPQPIHWQMRDYLKEAHPELWPNSADEASWGEAEVVQMLAQFEYFDSVQDHAAFFGITCEACHYGSRAHAEGQLKSPHFFPVSEHLVTVTDDSAEMLAKNKGNVNWICGRCHAGDRPQYANGIATWNSTEFSDAARGGCYSQLTCVDCHNPHQATGSQWKRSADQDDASCLKCHTAFEDARRRQQHTHHAPGSEGDRCLNCHMPRINEGLQDLVRTHTIFSPTDAEMIEANQPNACNMCHTDWTIDETLGWLKQWYGRSYSTQRIDASYPARSESVTLGWLRSPHESVRLVGADAMIRTETREALPELLRMLDDPYLINRQFVGRRLEAWLGIDLDDFGYRFYQMPVERAPGLQKLRDAVLTQ